MVGWLGLLLQIDKVRAKMEFLDGVRLSVCVSDVDGVAAWSHRWEFSYMRGYC